MKKTTITYSLLVLIAAVISFESCKKDDDDDQQAVPVPVEFIADNSSFSSFMNWPIQSTKQGPDPLLGAAHAGNDSSVSRKVRFKDGQSPVGGKYPIGTIILKHSSNPAGTVNEYTAMVKRGNNFNASKGDWEYFMLNSNGTIATDSSGAPMRGANLMGGMCVGCHSAAAAKDYIFSK